MPSQTWPEIISSVNNGLQAEAEETKSIFKMFQMIAVYVPAADDLGTNDSTAKHAAGKIKRVRNRQRRKKLLPKTMMNENGII